MRLFAYPYGTWTPAAFGHLPAAGVAFQLSGEADGPGSPLLTIRRRIADRAGARPTWRAAG